MPSKKERLDVLLVTRGLASTRSRATAMILAGNVLVNDTPVSKAGEQVPADVAIRLREPELRYVSRGALKLSAALDAFSVDVTGKTAIDVGSSTGGFSEVLLERGAAKIFAVDVGTNQLAWKIRNDPRVVTLEKYNARNLDPLDFPDPLQIAVMDVSFISVRLIIPSLLRVLQPEANIVILFKPQFEVGPEYVGAGGIVRDQDQAQRTLQELVDWTTTLGLEPRGVIPSPIQGTDGNTEYLAYWIAPKFKV